MRSDDDLGEEMLLSGGWSRRTIGGIAVAGLAVVAGLVVGLTHGGDGMSSARRPASSSQPTTLRLTTAPPGLVPGNNVLDLSLIGGEAVASSPAAPGRWTLTVSSDLTNYA